MKNLLFAVAFFMCFALSISAQEKHTLTVTVTQSDPLEFDASGEPAEVGDNSIFEVKGGTPPYSDIEWTPIQGEDPDYTHTVTVSDAHNCSVTLYVNVEGFVDIEEIFVDDRQVYPNPTSSIVNVPMSGSDNVTVMLINMEGRVLYKTSLKVTDYEYRLSLDSCPAGQYFIQVIGKDTKTYKVIKK